MHIVLVNRWYPPHTGWGGVAAYDYYLGHALSSLGHTVTVVASRLDDSTPAFQQDGPVSVHRLLGREHYLLGRLPLLGRYARPYLQFQYSRRVASFLRQLEKQAKPDIVEFAEINAEGFSYLRQRRRLPVVVRCHTPTFILKRYYTPAEMPFDTALTSRMERACIRERGCAIRPFAGHGAHDRRCLRTRSGQVHDHPQPPGYRPVCACCRICSATRSLVQALTILHVGRLERVKGVEVLAQSIPPVVRQFPQARFVFIGADRPDGQGSTWMRRLQAYFEEQNVAGHVQTARQPPPGGAAGLVPQGRYRRGALDAVRELLLHLRPGNGCRPARRRLPHRRHPGDPRDCGRIVEPGDAAGLAAALLRLISTPQERRILGESAQRRAYTCFDAIHVARATLAFYNELLDKGKS